VPDEPAAAGTLLVVGTPIGNLGDLSPRAAAALRESDLILAEDTRLAARLLAHLGARTPTLSLHEHNLGERLPTVLARLGAGQTLAFTTDAGMPAVSDPGARLVAAVRDAGARVTVIPGPSAVTAAVSIAGFEALGFGFLGFLPSRPASARRFALERAFAAGVSTSQPVVLFEAPHRVRSLLADLDAIAPEAPVVVCRELTKRHEEVRTGVASVLLQQLPKPRGEFVVIVDPRTIPPAAAADDARLDPARLAAEGIRQGLSPRAIADLLRAGGVPRREAYRLAAGEVEQP
jgi:16S rRNA (cytidine1402-2'-O)-methyltransferase